MPGPPAGRTPVTTPPHQLTPHPCPPAPSSNLTDSHIVGAPHFPATGPARARAPHDGGILSALRKEHPAGEPHPPPAAHRPPAGPYAPPPAPRARALACSFGRGSKAPATLGPVNADIAAGEFVCVVGPSDCGKSALLRIAAELVRPTEGALEIRASADRPHRRGPRHPRIHRPEGRVEVRVPRRPGAGRTARRRPVRPEAAPAGTGRRGRLPARLHPHGRHVLRRRPQGRPGLGRRAGPAARRRRVDPDLGAVAPDRPGGTGRSERAPRTGSGRPTARPVSPRVHRCRRTGSSTAVSPRRRSATGYGSRHDEGPDPQGIRAFVFSSGDRI
ncbi:ATP-binding cassette domain-containing protein [Streptomyces sp. NPDC015125]|uniref:ATP-binding cassette domain-containing protein n=1 Tax=Streptomyces sp. NPDC015125 TaxID=3364938 RepID=UPI0036FE8670